MKNTQAKKDKFWMKLELCRSGVIGGYRLLWVTMWASVLGFIMQVSILIIADMEFVKYFTLVRFLKFSILPEKSA